MAASDFDNDRSAADRAKDAAHKTSEAVQDAGKRAASAAGEYRDAAKSAANDLGTAANKATGDLKSAANDAANSVKDQAGDAQNAISGFADEARAKVAGIIDDQKNRGADQLQGFSRAAQSAAGELETNNPAVARLVRDAASTVDHLADDLRSTDIRDVVATVIGYARQQPIAFFAASVFVGFVLARFVKSEPTTLADQTGAASRSARI